MKMKIVFRKPYIYATIIIFAMYLLFLTLLSGFYNTIPLIIIYARTVSWAKLSLSIFLSLIIGLLVAINSVYVYAKYKERKQCKEAGTVATIGTVGGLVAGVCPLCVTGVFPLILGLFGISFSFASLPFQGIEIQLLAILILLVSLWMLNRKI
ncbi:MAG: hypothetical protein FD167_5168 [bacterium]|nr:MAG: hypothetical protein FD167_5168 [bacterium]